MKTQHKERTDDSENRVTITLVIEGGPDEVSSIRKQVEHYATALPGVRVEE